MTKRVSSLQSLFKWIQQLSTGRFAGLPFFIVVASMIVLIGGSAAALTENDQLRTALVEHVQTLMGIAPETKSTPQATALADTSDTTAPKDTNVPVDPKQGGSSSPSDDSQSSDQNTQPDSSPKPDPTPDPTSAPAATITGPSSATVPQGGLSDNVTVSMSDGSSQTWMPQNVGGDLGLVYIYGSGTGSATPSYTFQIKADPAAVVGHIYWVYVHIANSDTLYSLPVTVTN